MSYLFKSWLRSLAAPRKTAPVRRAALAVEAMEERANPARLYIPDTGLVGAPGDVVTVPVNVEVTEGGGINISSIDVYISFDPTRFTASNARFTGTALAPLGTPTSNFGTPGEAVISGNTAVGPTLTFGTDTAVLLIDFTVLAATTTVSSPINLRGDITALADDNAVPITLAPAPTNADTDADVDGAVIVNAPLTATITPVTPDPSGSPTPDSITVTFSEPIDPLTFTVADVSLTRDAVSVPLSGLTFTPSVGDTVVTITGLGAFTNVSGTYVFTVDATGVTDTFALAGTGTDSDTFVVDVTPPADPVMTGIADDTGASNTDLVTSDGTLFFNGTAEAGSTVTVSLVGSGVIGMVTATGAGTFSFDYTAVTLADGVYIVSATAADALGNTSGVSNSLTFTVDSAAPAAPTIGAVADDTGSSNSDGITSDNTLTVTGTAEPFSTVTLFEGANPIGTTTADLNGDYSITTAGLGDGVYSLTVTATDLAGNEGPASSPAVVVTVDATAPAAPVVTGFSDDTGASGTDGITNDNTLTITGTAEALSAITIYDGPTVIATGTADALGEFTIVTPALGDGTYALTATATDVAGNESAASTPALAVTVDTVAPANPAVTGVAADTGASGTDGVTGANTLFITGTAEAGSTVEISIDGTPVGTATADGIGAFSFDYTGTTLADGTYTITATATDAAGNPSGVSGDFTLVVDTLAPTAPVVLGYTDDSGTAGDLITNDNTLTVTGTAEPNSTVTIYNGATPVGTATADGAGNFTVTTSTLGEGLASLTLTATDLAGNEGAASSPALDVTIDTAAPAAPTITGFSQDTGATGDGITGDNTLTITGTAEANSTVTILDGATPVGTGTADGAGNFSITTTALADGAVSLTATATDAAANTGPASSPALAVTIDTAAPAAPVITGYTTDSGTAGDFITNDNTLTITGTAEPNSTVTIRNGVTPVGTATADGAGNFTVTTSALADGLATLTATATDAAANEGAPSLSLAVTVDTAAPAAPVISGFTADTGLVGDGITGDNTLTITGTAEANSTVTILDGATPVGTGTADGAGNFSITTSALADGPVSLTATATDAAANTGPASSPALVVTIDTAAPAAPVIVGFTDDSGTVGDLITNDNTLTVTGTAEANSTVTILNGATVVGTGTADGTGNFSITTSVLADGVASLTATATDAAANTGPASSPALEVTIDTAAPAAPVISGFADDSGAAGDMLTNDNTLTVTGTAEANSTVTILNGMTVVGTGTADGTGNFTITTSALADGAVSLTATATDAAANTGPASAPLAVTIDTAAPVVASLGSVDPKALATPVSITFSEKLAAGSFTAADLTLTRDGAPVATAGLTVTDSGDGITFRIGGLDAVATLPGAYVLTVNLPGVTDLAANAGGGTAALTFTGPNAQTVPQFALGGMVNGQPVVRFLNADQSVRFETVAFPGLTNYTGGVRTAVGDFNGDGVADVVVGTGPGAANFVRILDGTTGAEIASVRPFEASFAGGVFVAAGDLDGDGRAELVVTPDEGGSGRVVIFGGAGMGELASFFGIDDPNFRGGARAAVGDLNGDGVPDLVVAAGFGGGPRIAVYDGAKLFGGDRTKLVNDFFVFEEALRNGSFVAIGDVDGDGVNEIFAGAGPGGAPRVIAFSADTLLSSGPVAALGELDINFFAGDPNNRGGVRVATKDLDGDNKADLVVGPGVGGGTAVTGYLGADFSGGSADPEFTLDVPGANGGVFVA